MVEQRIGRLDRIGRTHPHRDRLLPAAGGASRGRWPSSTSGSASSASRWAGSSASCATSRARSRRRRWRAPARRPRRLSPASLARGAGGARPGARGGLPRAAPRPLPAGDGGGDPRRACRRTSTRLTEEVVLRAVRPLRLRRSSAQRGRRTWRVEFGYEALVDHLPGVPAGRDASSAPSTARRRSTTRRSTSSPPAIRWSKGCSPSSRRGRAAGWPLFQLAGDGRRLRPPRPLPARQRASRRWRSTARAPAGPSGRTRLTAGPIATEPVEAKKWTAQAGWGKTIRRMAAALPAGETPQAVAAFRVRRAGKA